MASWQRELKGLLKDQANAQRKGDLREESRICNCIGTLYSAHGNYERAYKVHLQECSLAESVGDQIGAAIAQRRIGECLGELQQFEEAIKYQQRHLRASRALHDLMEEQRSLATAGRMLYMWAEASSGDSRRARLLEAQQANLQSLEVCDRLQGAESSTEVMDMRCRVYLNLGLCYELQGDGERGLKFMKKAFVTARELKDMETVIRCHMSMGSLHTEQGDLDKALQAYEEARKVARKEKIAVQEAAAYEYMAATYACLEDFHSAKQSYKAACKLFSRQGMDREDVAKSLRKVRAVQHLLEQLKEPCELPLEEQRQRFDRLGDLCTSLGMHKVALQHYKRALKLAKSLSVDRKTLASAIVSVAVTCGDCGDHNAATQYYERELALWRGESPLEEYESWVQIARSRRKAGDGHEVVREALEQALLAAQRMDSNQKMVSLYAYMSEFYQSVGWDKEKQCVELERAQIVAQDPAAAESSEDEREDSQDGADEGMTSTESSSDEEERQMSVSLSGVARMRKKSRLTKRNEKGETLLHLAAIQGNTRIAEQLILEGACVNDRDNFGWTPLHEACNWGHLDMVRLLLDHGASPSDSGRVGGNSLTPLHDACSNMHVDVVRLLLESGADPSARSGRGQTALEQVTEMLKLTKETLANSSDGQRQSKAAERSASAQCLETIAALLMSHMPRGEVERETTGSAPFINRDYLMTEGASASPSQSLQEGAGRLLPARRVRQASVDRTGRGALEDEGGATQPHPLSGSDTFTSHDSPLDVSHSSLHKKFSPPALVYVGSSDEEDIAELTTSKTVVDNWLEEDTRDASRKRQRERLPATGISVSKRPRSNGGEGRALRTTALRQGSLRQCPSGRGLARQVSSEQLASEGSDLSFGCEQLSPPSSVTPPQPVVANPLSRVPSWDSNPGPSLPPASSHMRVRVTIERQTFLVPCPVSSSPSLSFAWLADEASSRYCSQVGKRPRLTLTTRDGAQLCLEDMLTNVLGHNEEVVGVVEGWDLPPLSEQYKACCKKAGQTPHSRVAHLLKDATALCLAGVHLKQGAVLPVLQCLHAQESLTEINLQGTKLGQDSLHLLGGVLLSLPRLSTLDLSCCMVTACGLSALVSAMVPHQGREGEGSLHALRQLSISYNHLKGAEGSLALLVGEAPTLRCLHIEHCSLQLAKLLGDTTAVVSSLCEFKAGGNKLERGGTAQSIMDMLAKGVAQKLDLSSLHAPGLGLGLQTGYSQLVSLNLHGCGVADVGLVAMQPSLVGHCPALQELTLSCNSLTAAALPALTRIVSAVVLLASLDLSGNQALGPDCVVLIPAAVRATHLQRLLLCATGARSPLGSLITDLGELKEQAQQPHSPSPLQLLDLSHNHIHSSDRAALLLAWQALWPGHSMQLDSTHNFSCSITSRL